MKKDKRMSLGSWIFLSVLVIIGGICLMLWISQSKPAPVATPTQDNSQALSDCIATNVTPLQHLAAINPDATDANVQQQDAQTALQACEAQYPNR